MNFSLKLSQLLGLGDIVNGIVGGFGETIQNLVNGYLSVFANQLYLIFLAFAKVLDLIQLLFKKLAGLDTYMLDNSSQIQEGDIVLALINSPQIKNVFWSMIILGVVLLIISTFVAVIKSEYQPLETKGANSKGKIIAKSLRSIVTMASVPVVSVAGLFMASALLESIDAATSGGQQSLLSTRIFLAAAYDANRARLGSSAYSQAFEDTLKTKNNFGIFIAGSSNFINETVADKIDGAFRDGTAVVGSNHATDFSAGIDGATQFVLTYLGEPNYPTSFQIHNFRLVWYYYNLNYFNYFVGIGAAIMLTALLMNVLLGLVKRIYALVMLFIVAPPIIAVTPMYEDAFKNWKKEFIKSSLSIFAVVVTMNVYIMLIPVLSNIDFFYVPPVNNLNDAAEAALNVGYEILNFLAQLLILIGGAVFFKDFSKTIASMIGADDALGDGAGKSDQFIKTAAKAAAVASGVGALMPLTPGMGAKAVYSGANKSFKKSLANGDSVWKAGVKGLGGALSAPTLDLINKRDENGNRIGALATAGGYLKNAAAAPKKFWDSNLANQLGFKKLFPESEFKKKQKEKAKEAEAKALEKQRHAELVDANLNGESIKQDKEESAKFEGLMAKAKPMLEGQFTQEIKTAEVEEQDLFNTLNQLKNKKTEPQNKADEKAIEEEMKKVQTQIIQVQDKKKSLQSEFEGLENNMKSLVAMRNKDKVSTGEMVKKFEKVVDKQTAAFNRILSTTDTLLKDVVNKKD